MKFKKFFYLFVVFVFTLSSCSEGNGLENDFRPATYSVLGKVEKGPFVSGSTITIQPMDGNLQMLGSLYSSTIQDDLGNFLFGSKLFESPYAELTANGYFFNEVSGKLSQSTLSLRALVDLSDKTTVNVNLFTHLKYQRVQKLVADGIKFGDANTQAQKELFIAFGLQKYTEKDASTFSITGGTDESAALIAVSSLLLVGRSEAALTEYLAKLCREFGEKGSFEENTKQQINKDKEVVKNRLSSVRNNVIARYESLGLNVEVKDLRRFIDWDNDGIVGNEVLQEGQEIKLETTKLYVPNEGGVYEIGISSPVPVYLEPQSDVGEVGGETSVEQNMDIYEGIAGGNISMEKSLDDNILTITIKPLYSKSSKTSYIAIYDGLSNVVGHIEITQEGNSAISIPKLGDTGKELVVDFASYMAHGFSEFNVIEQYYHWNKEADYVNQYVSPNNGTISDMWGAFYSANNQIMRFKDTEAKQAAVYQDYFNVFSAMLYYYMVVAWGDVPYYNFVSDQFMPRTPQNEIFADLKTNLEKAIDYFEEKRNNSLSNDANDFFFLSKDVARILLADICMYQGEYNGARQLLKQVISNHFYELDASNYNNEETINDLFDKGNNREIIFAIKYYNEIRTRGNISIVTPTFMPIMTYTDVMLAYAECLYKNGMTSDAKKQLLQVIEAKNISVSGNSILEKIKDARLQLMLYTNTNFAFMKRNNLSNETYSIEEYKTLLPIPLTQIFRNPYMTQNPGY